MADFTITEHDVTSYLKQFYDIQTKHVIRCDGYDDANFAATSVSGEKFIVKISSLSNASNVPLLEEINRLLTFIGDNGLSVPLPIPLYTSHEKLVHVTIGPSKTVLRVFRFVEGVLLAKVEMKKSLLIKVAEYAAKLHLTFKNFHSDVITNHQYIWHLRQAPMLLHDEYLSVIQDDSKRQLVVNVLSQFKETLARSISLPHSIIHGDLNEANILISQDHEDIAGVIDFSDVDYAPRVFDLATLCLYMLLETEDSSNTQAMVQAYEKIVTLTSDEKQIIPLCMKARLAQSLTLGAVSFSKNPANDYVLKTAINGWRILEQLDSASGDAS